MNILFNEKTLRHNISSDIEGPYRIEKIAAMVPSINPTIDGEKFLASVHASSYIDYIRNGCMQNDILAEVQLSEDTFEAACVSVGLAIQAALNDDFAVTRPPGHHASSNLASGFCIFNNIAIATRYLTQQGKNVFIVDIDGHHGNGTESIFLKDSNVLYSSIHQENTFPGTANEPKILKYNKNTSSIRFPIPAGSGDDVFRTAILEIMELANEFKPDVIGVSAGFDGYYNDKLLGLRFTEKGFYDIGKDLTRMKVPIFSVLEGGYHNHVAECMQSFVDGVNNKKFRFDAEASISSNEVKASFEINLRRLLSGK